MEMQRLAGLVNGRRIHPDTSLVVTTSPEIKFAADRKGLTARIEAAGTIVAAGVCFHQSYAREMAEARLAAAPHQFGQARQHHCRLRVQADAGQHGTLPRQRCRRDHCMMPIVLKCHKGLGQRYPAPR